MSCLRMFFFLCNYLSMPVLEFVDLFNLCVGDLGGALE